MKRKQSQCYFLSLGTSVLTSRLSLPVLLVSVAIVVSTNVWLGKLATLFISNWQICRFSIENVNILLCLCLWLLLNMVRSFSRGDLNSCELSNMADRKWDRDWLTDFHWSKWGWNVLWRQQTCSGNFVRVRSRSFHDNLTSYNHYVEEMLHIVLQTDLKMGFWK